MDNFVWIVEERHKVRAGFTATRWSNWKPTTNCRFSMRTVRETIKLLEKAYKLHGSEFRPTRYVPAPKVRNR